MRYYALATDYDGTLAHNGKVDDGTYAALERLRTTRRKLILVTGRRLDDLMTVFDRIEIFDRVVAENGALVYNPATHEEQVLGDPPPPQFAERLRAAGAPVDVGRVIVATWSPHETTVLDTLREMGLEHHIIFNKGAVMVLPPNVNKASGLQAALADLGLSAHNAVAVGDAENDLALLNFCEFAAAVENALPSVKESVDWVTPRDHGAGGAELIDKLIADDLHEFQDRLARRGLSLGVNENGADVRVSPYATNILLAGSSGSGKSTFATGFMERLAEQGYQFCCIDPEGDYAALADAVIKHINVLIAIGESPAERYEDFERATGSAAPRPPQEALEQGEAWWWRVGDGAVERIRTHGSTSERRRHVRKYAEGELEPERSFYFRGPHGALNLRAQNLIIFMQLAEGVDEATWEYHLRCGDYSRWYRTAIN